jgi:selenocysteine lyase/cysteine desulfurase
MSQQTNLKTEDAYSELERGVQAALETYSNVHRGSGHNSMVTTHLFETAREIVLDYLGLNKSKYTVIFCSPRRAATLTNQLKPEDYQSISSQEIGLTLGVKALAINKKVLPEGAPFQTGGGTTRLISKEWIVWANAPDRFEAGTPAIINIIAFAKALRIIQQSGKDIFMNPVAEKLTASEILYQDELEQYSGHELLDKLKETLIGRGVLVPTMEGNKPFINFDNSASTPTFMSIWNAFRQAGYQSEQVKQAIIHEVRTICAEGLGAPLTDYDVIFTSNATEAINLAAESLSYESDKDTEPVVLNTLLEHSSNDLPWRRMPGCSVIRLSVDAEGFVDLNEMETLLSTYNQKCQFGKKRIKLVAMSGASNVLGICNNLAEISRIVHQYGARLLVDAAQLVAHRRVRMEESGIDYLAFSAHKIYAPFGCGALMVRKGLLKFNSAELDLIQSSGEENAGGIAALGKVLVLLQRIGMDLIREEEQALTAYALQGMAKIPGLRIYGVNDPESPGFAYKVGVIVFAMKSMMPNQMAKELALRSGIGIRFGCHCAHIIIKHLLNVGPSLERFQRLIVTIFPKLRLPGLDRISFGIENSKEEVDTLIQVLAEIAGKPKTLAYKNAAITDSGTSGFSGKEVQKQMDEFVRVAARRVYEIS